MDPSASRGPASAGLPVIVEEPAWRRFMPRAERVAGAAARAAGSAGQVVLAADRAVKRLNARHRGRNKPTNILTYEPVASGTGGEMVLALGVVRREAALAGRRPTHHLAHLVVHGALHLHGHDHVQPGDARRMEMAEARILRRLGVSNPWRRA